MRPPNAPPPLALVEPTPRPKDPGPNAILVVLDGETPGDRVDLCGPCEMEFVIVATGRRARRLVRRGRQWFAVLADGHEVDLPNRALLRSDTATFRFLAGPELESEYHQQLYDLAVYDTGTRALGRAYFDEVLPKEVATAHRLGRPLALAFLRLLAADTDAQLGRLRQHVLELNEIDRIVVCRFDERTLVALVLAERGEEPQDLLETVLESARCTSTPHEVASAILGTEEDGDEFLARVLGELRT